MGTLAGAAFVCGCGVVTYYTRTSGLRTMVVTPPLVFLAGCAFAEVLTAARALPGRGADPGHAGNLGPLAVHRDGADRRGRDRPRLPADAAPQVSEPPAGTAPPLRPQLARQRERHVLRDRLDFLDGAEPELASLASTEATSSSGTDAPLVTPTVVTPSSQRSSTSPASSTR